MKSKGKENDLQIKAQEVSRQQDLIILMLQLHFYLLILTARTERSERRSESELRFASLFFPVVRMLRSSGALLWIGNSWKTIDRNRSVQSSVASFETAMKEPENAQKETRKSKHQKSKLKEKIMLKVGFHARNVIHSTHNPDHRKAMLRIGKDLRSVVWFMMVHDSPNDFLASSN